MCRGTPIFSLLFRVRMRSPKLLAIKHIELTDRFQDHDQGPVSAIVEWHRSPRNRLLNRSTKVFLQILPFSRRSSTPLLAILLLLFSLDDLQGTASGSLWSLPTCSFLRDGCYFCLAQSSWRWVVVSGSKRKDDELACCKSPCHVNSTPPWSRLSLRSTFWRLGWGSESLLYWLSKLPSNIACLI